MKLMAYTNPDNEDEYKEVPALYVDGYGFGDRLLEGVPFQLTVANGVLKARCMNKYAPGIDWDYWEKKCASLASAGEFDCLATTRAIDNDYGFITGNDNDA